jgi:peptidoglycan/xylan/chitin deacetylase (PgdA/CDA1 family)
LRHNHRFADEFLVSDGGEELSTHIKEWPNAAKIAVLVTPMFETWSIGKAPSYSPMTSPLKPGVVDRIGVSWSEYGGRTGIWRFMKIFETYGIPATVCVSGRSVELFPEAVKALHDKGHELAGHSYTQDTFLTDLAPDKEREVIDKCFGLIEGAVGVKPVGWLSPRATATEHTAGFLAEQGCSWHGDYNDTDVPYKLETPPGTIVAIPHTDFADNRVLRGSPRDFLNVYKDTFDFLYGSDSPEMINLTVHAHFGGRPMISAMLAEIVKYMKGFPRVWFARHDEVANWVLEN